MKAFLLLINLSFFLQQVASLSIMVKRDTSVADNQGAVSSPSPTQQLGTAQVVFPTQGPRGTNNKVNAVLAPSALPDSGTMQTATSASVSSQPSGPNHANQNIKALIIVGSVIGAIAVIAIILFLIRFINRRRQLEEMTKRWSFHRDMMVQSRRPQVSIPQMSQDISRSATIATRPQDLEQGIPDPEPVVPRMDRASQDAQLGHADPIPNPTSIVVGPRGPGPKTPRRLDLHSPRALPPLPNTPRTPRTPLPRTPRSPAIIPPRVSSAIPRSPSPRTHRQRAISDQIEMLRIQMLQFERAGGKDSTDGAVVMDEMYKKMAWLRDQQEGSWALGLTEVTPLGYDRYMT